jgi:hypothetical protein
MIAVHFRHEYIKQNNVRQLLLRALKPALPAICRIDGVFVAEDMAERLYVYRVVVDDEYFVFFHNTTS